MSNTQTDLASAEEAQRINEEFKIWKKNSAFLYDIVVIHATEWPSLTCDWLPNPVVDEDRKKTVFSVVLGTHTADDVCNKLLLANVTLPRRNAGVDDMEMQDDDGEKTNCVSIVKEFPHDGEVHRARHCPQKSTLVATVSPSGKTCLYSLDADLDGDAENNPSACSGLVASGAAHGTEAYALGWSSVVSGRFVSGANDGSVAFWNSEGASGALQAVAKVAHPGGSAINDIAMSKTSGDVAFAVSDAGDVCIWDARKSEMAGHHQNLHGCEAMSIDVNPQHTNLLLTGAADGVIKLWDARNMGKFLHSMEHHEDQVLSVRWSPHSPSHFASGCADRRVNVWDLGRIGKEQLADDGQDGPSELLFSHGGHTSQISDISWSLGGETGFNEMLLGSVSDDNVFQCWQMHTSLYAEDADDEFSKKLE